VPPDDVHEERSLLRSLIVSDYAEFQRIVSADGRLAFAPTATLMEQIESYLKLKYGDAYESERL
jgi:hypothetical protein